MTTTLQRETASRTSRITYHGSARDCWKAMASYWGMETADGARHKIREAREVFSDLIRQAHRAGRQDWVRSAFAALDIERVGPAMDNEPWLLAAVAKLDGKEDGSLAALLAEPACRRTAEQWLRDAAAEIQAKQEAMHAVKTALGAS